MPKFNRPSAAAWAWIAIGVVFVAGVVTLITVILLPGADLSNVDPFEEHGGSSSAPTVSSTAPSAEFVDPEAVELGLIPQPITDDAEAYMRAAILAAFTWDASKSTSEQRNEHLARWVTAPGMFTSQDDELAALLSGQQGFARMDYEAPQVDWLDASRNGMTQSAEIVYVEPVIVDTSDGPPRQFWNFTVDVQRSWTDRVTGEEIDLAFRFNGSMIISCGQSQPPADSAQTPSDCMVWNFSSEKVY